MAKAQAQAQPEVISEQQEHAFTVLMKCGSIQGPVSTPRTPLLRRF